MLKFAKVAALACAVLLSACAAQAQTTQTATIDDAAWLAGRWVGEGFDGQMEEVWSPPVGGQMIGHFRYWQNGAPQFYEIMMMDVAEGGVRMRVKHFNPDFIGWEERGEWATFEPVLATGDRLLFDGLDIQRQGADRMVMSIRIRRGDGVDEEILRFRRAPF
jgi:hypothetical protein